ncbi:MAG: helix-turn-helix transcriptional regulator [Beijerinckiaceae bacterium]|nr:helix-turn-helix transcriptional regulator [Beijerinckiaceae bacterium]
MLTGSQIRAARALLNWNASDVAEKVSVTRQTILRLEQSDGVPASKTQTMLALQKVFEEGGVEFIGSPEDRPGVRMRF